jgi:hypothetical protein
MKKALLLILLTFVYNLDREAFYTRVLKEANNTNVLIGNDEAGSYISAITNDGKETLEIDQEFLKVPEKYIIYGCN